MSLEDRDTAIPPSDSLAEGIVLHGLLFNPQRLAGRDLRPLLQFPEHRWCYDAMRRAYAVAPPDNWAEFFIVWRADLEHGHPGQGNALVQLVLDASDDETDWMFRRYADDKERNADVAPRLVDQQHDWDWWVARLERIAVARGMLVMLNDAGARAWNADTDGALTVIEDVRAMFVRVEQQASADELLEWLDV